MFLKKHKDNGQNRKGAEQYIAFSIRLSIIISSLGIVAFAWQAPCWPQFLSILGVSFMIAGASLLTGGFLGFLFGIPRTTLPEKGEEARPRKQPESQPQDSQQGSSYQANTNLEQISDWLSKILVGVGLTQIASLPEVLSKYAAYTAEGLGNFPNSQVFSVALLIFFLVCGFLIGYLWTRLFLPGALTEAEARALRGKLREVESKVSELEKQAELDAKALSLTQRQLNPGREIPTVTQEELSAAIKMASSDMRAQIFYLAQRVRSENWQHPYTKEKMERTIPIFQALIASDEEDKYHANHGQLGFALKDQRNPDWKGAEVELTKAIDIRGPWREKGWLIYEFVRALCRINLDPGFKDGRASDEQTKGAIETDLLAAAQVDWLAGLISEEETIQQWAQLNGIKLPAS